MKNHRLGCTPAHEDGTKFGLLHAHLDSPTKLGHAFREPPEHLLVVVHDTPVCTLEDLRAGFGIYCHNRLGSGNARQMLWRTRDAHGNVQVGGHRGPGQAHLVPRGYPAGVGHRSRAGHRSVQDCGCLFDPVPVLRAADAAAAAAACSRDRSNVPSQSPPTTNTPAIRATPLREGDRPAQRPLLPRCRR